MPAPLEFSHTLMLPLVENVHTSLVAFFETSDWGAWKADDIEESTSFRLNLLRGNWGRAILGSKRVPKICDAGASGKEIPRTKPMMLEVTIRPSPERIRINLRHQVFAPKNGISNPVYWRRYVFGEVDSLRDYLRECFKLDELPKLNNE